MTRLNVQIPAIVGVDLRDWKGVPAGDDFVKRSIIEGLTYLHNNPDEGMYYQQTGDTLVLFSREDMGEYHHHVNVTVCTVRQSAYVDLPKGN